MNGTFRPVARPRPLREGDRVLIGGAEIADCLRCSHSAVYSCSSRGDLPVAKRGVSPVTTTGLLEDWIRDQALARTRKIREAKAAVA